MTYRLAVVLLSGGVDSTTCLYHAYHAKPSYQEVHAVSVDYGQRHLKETDYARRSCKKLGIAHHMLKAPDIFPKSMLTDVSEKVPDISYGDIIGVSPTYVPFRNGTMLSLLTAFTEGMIKKYQDTLTAGSTYKTGVEADLYFGAHAEDAANWAYPDCTPEFIGAMANAIYIGSYRRIRLCTPLGWLDKTHVIMHGQELHVPWENTWSCYKGLEFQCGVCPTCRSRREGFENAGVKDPTTYANGAPTGDVR
jgi:7-cyano-7-deazaguanine synthase